MSNPAQRPPEHATLEVFVHASTEVVLLALSFVVGIAVLMVLMAVGLLPDAEAAGWSGIVAGPVLIGTAALAYLGIERLMLRNQVAPTLGVLAHKGESSQPLVPARERKGAVACVLIALGGIVVALVGSGLLGVIQQQLFATEVQEQQAILELVGRRETFELVLLAVSAVVLAPLTEELLFRHMFFRRLLHGSGPTLAWILPAVAFSFAHWNPVGAVIYVWLGLVFAYSYLLSGRLWVAMVVHAGHNAFALSVLLWAPNALPSAPEGFLGG
ncbi:CPBP family intramembrane glutamic endopeptidase [Enhygromyxa salina]|uniref:CAAX amino terminal protease self-immunity n=1 Tax=Enhygromyxa salina TaxID=215803 RepID=A0A2S9YWV2_9BACT|nr:CPBP family intramembrane glutamic endopeptidase [Enhygromyxa salina]PRQ09567.1 CAAX amino terminal protease self- immunity [Enhygromyxa salina]